MTYCLTVVAGSPVLVLALHGVDAVYIVHARLCLDTHFSSWSASKVPRTDLRVAQQSSVLDFFQPQITPLVRRV